MSLFVFLCLLVLLLCLFRFLICFCFFVCFSGLMSLPVEAFARCVDVAQFEALLVPAVCQLFDLRFLFLELRLDLFSALPGKGKEEKGRT